LTRQTEIGDFENATTGIEQIRRLEITMNDPIVMQMSDTSEQLLRMSEQIVNNTSTPQDLLVTLNI
jgi:hypothetical protein